MMYGHWLQVAHYIVDEENNNKDNNYAIQYNHTIKITIQYNVIFKLHLIQKKYLSYDTA